MDNGNRMILKRKYYAVEIKLASPLCISSGANEATDADVLVDKEGNPFIPGTSLAGAIRNYLDLKKDANGMMGYTKKDDSVEQGRMSSLFISDVYLEKAEKDLTISVRDGIELTEEKTVNNKFDMQVVETGAVGMLYLNYVIREKDNEEEYDNCIRHALNAIQSGEIRIGSNKNRGFGRLAISKIWEKEFACKSEAFDISEWISFKKNSRNVELYSNPNGMKLKNWSTDKEHFDKGKYIKIKVPLKLTGGISIRKYSTQPQKADYEHLTCNGEPVIPGTSWNGAIRADVRDILSSLGMKSSDINKIMESWFGYVRGQKAMQSKLVFGESVIRNSTALPMTRNKINRFDSSTIDGALYSEISYFGGTTTLEIMVQNDAANKNALLAVLDMVIKDIQEGYLPVGGQTAVGRGIFEGNGDITYSCDEDISRDKYKEELYRLISSEEVQDGVE